MQSSNTMIKLQYQEETRRFQVSLGSSFSELFALVRKLYSISHSSIVLKWKDEEGDLVTISTDDEVVVALNHSTLLRLFVYDAPLIEDESEGNLEEPSSEIEVEKAPNNEGRTRQIEANLERIDSNLNDDTLPAHKKERLEQRRKKLQMKLEVIKSGAACGQRGGRRGRGRGGRGRGRRGGRGGQGPAGPRRAGRGCPGQRNRSDPFVVSKSQLDGEEQSPMENPPSSQPEMSQVKLVLLECRINLKNARASRDSSAIALAQASLKEAQANMCAHRQKVRQDRLAQKEARQNLQTEKRALRPAEREAARQKAQAERRALRAERQATRGKGVRKVRR